MKSILFVDDHEVLARLSCEILEMQGYRAVSACSGAEALKKFEQEEFDLLVTDFRMNGMNGLELARKLHEKSPNVPVIIVTGYDPIDGGKGWSWHGSHIHPVDHPYSWGRYGPGFGPIDAGQRRRGYRTGIHPIDGCDRRSWDRAGIDAIDSAR